MKTKENNKEISKIQNDLYVIEVSSNSFNSLIGYNRYTKIDKDEKITVKSYEKDKNSLTEHLLSQYKYNQLIEINNFYEKAIQAILYQSEENINFEEYDKLINNYNECISKLNEISSEINHQKEKDYLEHQMRSYLNQLKEDNYKQYNPNDYSTITCVHYILKNQKVYDILGNYCKEQEDFTNNDSEIKKSDHTFHLFHKNNCELYINGNKEEFTRTFEFDEPGKNIVEFKFKGVLHSAEDMFYKVNTMIGISFENVYLGDSASFEYMFQSCTALRQINLSFFNCCKVKSLLSMFSGCTNLTKINFINFDTSSVENMKCLFDGCWSLKNIDLSKLKSKNVKCIVNMFSNCNELSSINMSNFNPVFLTDTRGMFFNCCKLTYVNVSCLNTSEVTDMSYMFMRCKSLVSLDLSNFNTNKVKYFFKMFNECKKLKSLNISSFNTKSIKENNSIMFDKENSLVKSLCKIPDCIVKINGGKINYKQ